MGLCLPCLGGESSDDYDQPSTEERRRQQAEAADKRLKEQEGRGVKDPERLKRKQQQAEAAERRAEETRDQGGGLQWQVS